MTRLDWRRAKRFETESPGGFWADFEYERENLKALRQRQRAEDIRDGFVPGKRHLGIRLLTHGRHQAIRTAPQTAGSHQKRTETMQDQKKTFEPPTHRLRIKKKGGGGQGRYILDGRIDPEKGSIALWPAKSWTSKKTGEVVPGVVGLTVKLSDGTTLDLTEHYMDVYPMERRESIF